MIKILARDAETGRIGTYQTNFAVPNLNEEKRLPTALSCSAASASLSDALYSVGRRSRRISESPRLDGRKLIPSVTRVFSKGREFYVYLQAYQRAAAETQPLVARRGVL